MDCVISHIISPGEFFAQVGNVKQFDDFDKLVKIVQQYCKQRLSHFHSVSNVNVGEVVFFKSTLRDGEFVRGRVITSTTERCSLSLIDYGPKELEVSCVLKIDPSVQRFSTINPFARKFSLAFVKPVGGKWCSEATEVFKQHCQGRLIYLPTEDPDYITIVTRTLEPPQGVIDVSVLLIQAGYARRVSSASEEDSLPPSIAASVSDVTQQLHSVGIQTEVGETEQTALPAPIEFSNGGGGDGCGDHVKSAPTALQKATANKPCNIYVPPALRCEAKADACRYQQFRLNHDSFCSCLTCTIRTTLEDFQLTNKERLMAVLSTTWLKLTCKDEAILRCAITGTSLNSEERELLLDVFLGITRQQVMAEVVKERPRKRSIDSATQVTSSSNRLTLSSYAVDLEDDARSTATSEDITIMRKSSGKVQSTLAAEKAQAAGGAQASRSVDDIWSDLDNQSINSTDSEPDVIADSSRSTCTSSTKGTVVVNQSAFSNASANTLPGSSFAKSFGSDGSPAVGRKLFSPASTPSQGPTSSSMLNTPLDAGSPGYTQGTTPTSPGCIHVAPPPSPGYTHVATPTSSGYTHVATPPSSGYTHVVTPPSPGYTHVATPPTPGYTHVATPPTPGYAYIATPPGPGCMQRTASVNPGYTRLTTSHSPGCIQETNSGSCRGTTPSSPGYGQRATPSSPGYGQQATPSSPGYGQRATPSSPGYGQQATPSSPGYGQRATPSSPGYGQRATPSSPGYGQGATPSSPGYGQGATPSSPGYGQGATPSSPGYGQRATPSSPGYGQGATPSSPGYGQGPTPISPGNKHVPQSLSTTRSSLGPTKATNCTSCPPLNNPSRESVSVESHGSSTTCSDDMNSIIGNFGMIMYCSFCGATQHRSSNCPTGTKDLFN